MRPVRGSGDRAQAIQLGALLLFAILIINLSLYQVFVVPDQNGEIEFKHNEQAQEEMKIVRNTVFQTSVTGTDLTTSVQLAPQYPSRTVFVNPGPPSGSLRTESLGGVSFDNIEPTDNETSQFWIASTPTPTTSRLVYRPNYNVYTAPDTVYESSVVFNSGDGAPDRTLTGQSIVNGRRISLVTLTGNVGTTATGSESLELKGVSASREPIPVHGGSGPLNVTIPTTLSESEWEELLSEQRDDDNLGVGVPTDGDEQFLTNISYDDSTSPTTVTLTFEEGVQYDLRLARVGVGSGVTSPGAAYITDVESPATVDDDGTVEYVMEVRDELNNPVSGVEVNATATDSPVDIGSFNAGSETTDSDGRASFVFDAGTVDATGTEDLEFNISDVDGSGSVEDYEVVEQSLTAQSSDSSDGGDGTPPAATSMNASPSTISSGENFTLSATFDDTSGRGGSDIFEPEWVDTVSGNSGVFSPADGQFDQAVEDVEATVSGNTTDDWSAGDHEINITGTDANGNNQTTSVVVSVSTSASRVTYNSDGMADGPGNTDGVRFSVTNTGSGNVTITDIAVDSNESADELLEKNSMMSGQWNREAFIDTTDNGYLETGDGGNDEYTLGSGAVPLNEEATVSSGSSATVSLYRFTEAGAGGSGGPVDMQGESVTVELTFADGSTETVTFTG